MMQVTKSLAKMNRALYSPPSTWWGTFLAAVHARIPSFTGEEVAISLQSLVQLRVPLPGAVWGPWVIRRSFEQLHVCNVEVGDAWQLHAAWI
jgi:hypothetical protein